MLPNIHIEKTHLMSIFINSNLNLSTFHFTFQSENMVRGFLVNHLLKDENSVLWSIRLSFSMSHAFLTKTADNSDAGTDGDEIRCLRTKRPATLPRACRSMDNSPADEICHQLMSISKDFMRLGFEADPTRGLNLIAISSRALIVRGFVRNAWFIGKGQKLLHSVQRSRVCWWASAN